MTCIVCSLPLGRKDKVKCSSCEQWRHRLCGTKISRVDYFEAIRRNGSYNGFRCEDCERSVENHIELVTSASPVITPVARQTTRRRRPPVCYTQSENMHPATTHQSINLTLAEDLAILAISNESELTSSSKILLSSSNNENHEADGYVSDGERPAANPEPEEDPLPSIKEDMTIPTEPFYSILRKGTTHGSALLSDGLGFRYGLKNHSSWSTWHWCCTHRTPNAKSEPCKARVSQKVEFTATPAEILSSVEVSDKKLASKAIIDGKMAALKEVCQGNFTFRSHNDENPHNHQQDFGTEVRSKQVRDAKALAEKHPFVSAGRVVDMMLASLSPAKQKSQYVAPKNVVRAINRNRADRFPAIDTTTYDYKVKLDAVPGNLMKREHV